MFDGDNINMVRIVVFDGGKIYPIVSNYLGLRTIKGHIRASEGWALVPYPEKKIFSVAALFYFPEKKIISLVALSIFRKYFLWQHFSIFLKRK